jgi:ribosomal protein L30/L7E
MSSSRHARETTVNAQRWDGLSARPGWGQLSSGLPDEGQQQRPAELRRRVSLIGRKPDLHAVLAALRLCRVSAEQPVPEREIEPVIRIMLAPEHRVVHPVHIRGDDEQAQHPVEP